MSRWFQRSWASVIALTEKIVEVTLTPITMSGEDFFIQLNFQLIHLVDFLPVANWAMHQNDTAFILFRDLYDLLERAGKKGARLRYTPASGPRRLVGEEQGIGGRLTTLIPVSLSEKMAAGSVRTGASGSGPPAIRRVYCSGEAPSRKPPRAGASASRWRRRLIASKAGRSAASAGRRRGPADMSAGTG